ncbi:MAG: hypothetical protein HQK51_10145 [Oligoflexia bacterium]|nr:hypothetical protein [Oligoflexia bacterium]
MKIKLLLIPFYLLVAIAIPLQHTFLDNAAAEEKIIIEKKAPIPFVPFTLSNLKNPATNAPYAENEFIKIEIEGKIKWEGYAKELIELMNKMEEQYCALGISLKKDGPLILSELTKNPELFSEQSLKALKLKASVIKDKIKTAIKDCKILEIKELGVNVRTNVQFSPNDKIELDGIQLTIGDFLTRINEQQEFLCSIGHDLLEGFENYMASFSSSNSSGGDSPFNFLMQRK